jgi:8-oxo-dGTP pyrophosphatase MutT (NUDIX family)
LEPTFGPDLRRTLEERLDAFERQEQARAGAVRAAVALAVVTDEKRRPSLLLTRRARGMRRHAGQWALPGGRLDPGEGPVEAALRELHEELGLDLPREEVLGCLDDYRTRSGYVVTPVVVWGPAEPRLVPEPGEVAAVYRATLEEMGRPGAAKISRLPWRRRPLLALSMLGTVIFAPTAAILLQFAELAVHGRTTRVDHFDQPRFAWR